MRRRFMEKGAEQGLWNAESFSAESADGEEVHTEDRIKNVISGYGFFCVRSFKP